MMMIQGHLDEIILVAFPRAHAAKHLLDTVGVGAPT